jgi:hypothetical protein
MTSSVFMLTPVSETGLVTAGLAFTLCITWAIMPYNEVWNGVLFVYTRANANAVLVALNSRREQGRLAQRCKRCRLGEPLDDLLHSRRPGGHRDEPYHEGRDLHPDADGYGR